MNVELGNRDLFNEPRPPLRVTNSRIVQYNLRHDYVHLGGCAQHGGEAGAEGLHHLSVVCCGVPNYFGAYLSILL